jgi:hypothetical protein
MTLCRVDSACRRTVLVVVSSVEAGMWLMDAVPLLAADHRVATYFTVAPAAGSPHVTAFLRGLPILPWHQAVRREFDLVLAADPHGLAQLHGKTLLLPRDAMGDLCYDRLMASIPFRAGYRRVFGLVRGQRLVVVESTVDDRVEVLDRLLAALPPERYRVAFLSPRMWAHGEWQVHMWLADLLRAGLLLPQPESWRATLIAADVVVGDFGMATRYGAAIGLPVLASLSVADHPLDGATELVRRHARRLDVERPMPDQIEAVLRADRGWQDRVADLVTAQSGRAGDLLRTAMYELLGLPEPTSPDPCLPVAAPCLGDGWSTPLVGPRW